MPEIKPMELIPPTGEQMEKICKEYNLNEDELKKDTQKLKEWLKSQPHLPHDLDDNILTSFIVGCKNSIERSKQTLDKYLTNRTACPDFYSSRDPCDPGYRKQAKLLQYFVLPSMTPEGYRVSVIRMASPDVSTADFSLRMNASQFLSSYDIRFQEEHYWAGDVLIIDFKNFTLKHIQALMSITVVSKYFHCSQESLPVRYKKIIYINLSPAVESILPFVMKLMKKKLVDRMIITSEDHTFLHGHIPKDILPNEYGGKAGSIEDLNDSWQLKVESYREWFLKDMLRSVDESKRPEKSKKYGDDLGIAGSFKTLVVD